MTRHRAAIAGLGQAGLLFDRDAKRQGVWTHFSAYERLADRFELVAACDPDLERRELAAARRPSLRVFESLGELVASCPVDVVSLCTPIELHARQIEECAGSVRAIVCEKPLGTDASLGERAVEACAAAGTVLAVNYYKRFEATVQAARSVLADGSLGEVQTAIGLYSGPLDAVGSHAVDLLRFLLGPLEVRTAARQGQRETALLTFGRQGMAMLSATGPREDLVFELDLIGSAGRLKLLDNCARLELSRFAESARYGGYRELVPQPLDAPATVERFVPLFLEVADALDGAMDGLTSDGASALETQRLLDELARG